MKKIILFTYALLATVIFANAQITVHAPQQIGVGEQFRLQYSVSTTDVKGFRAGNIPDAFDVLMGPSTSTQQSFQMINGRTTSSSSVTYTYILCANKKGTFTIPGARAKVDGKDAVSQAVKIIVSGSSAQANGARNQGNAQRQYGSRPQQAGSRISGNDLFIKISANKQKVYEQEPILLTYKVYTQVELTQLEGKMPDLKGFHTQEIQLPQQKSFHLESINGRPYRCVTWSQYVMYPQVSGKLEIPSITFKGIVVQENPNVDPFEAFFNGGSGYVEVKKEIKAPGMTLMVEPLPEKPAGFSGGVGQFSVTATADKTSVKAGDPVTIRVAVSGNGNLKLIKQPELSLPNDFDKYDPKVTDKTSLSASGLSGSMNYEFLVVPRNKGDYEIPAIEFIYFDTASRAYKTIKTNPIKLNVAQGDGKSGASADFTQKEDNDIYSIHTGAANNSASSMSDIASYFGSALYYVVNALLLCLLLSILVFFRKRAMEIANITLTKSKRANKIATKRLRKAMNFMQKKDASNFYDEVMRALWGYVSDKLSMPVSQLSRQNIQQCLTEKGVENADINSFIETLDECEYQRYAPGDPEGNMQKTLEKATTAIIQIEEGMKKGKSNGIGGSAFNRNMMLVVLICISAMLPVSIVSAADSTPYLETKSTADSAYIKGDYQKAITLYNALLKQTPSADVYYNLGNAYYRTNNITQSILSYERAKVMRPGDKDVKHNLKVVVTKTIDNLPQDDSNFFDNCYTSVRDAYSVDSWAKTATVAFFLCIIFFCAYLFLNNIMLRKLTFYVSALMLIVFLLGNFLAWRQQQFSENYSGAVVTSAALNMMKTPSMQSEKVGVLHEGSHVDITDDSMQNWYQVSISDGRKGWIESKGVEKVLK